MAEVTSGYPMHTWTVEGANKSTGYDVVRSIEALTEQEAAEIAANDGILVSSVRMSDDERPRPATRHVPSAPDYTAVLREIAGHTRTIRAWVSLMGILALVVVISELLRLIALR
jgi:hypothetical protein